MALRKAQPDLTGEVVTKIVFALKHIYKASPCLVAAMKLGTPDDWIKLKELLGDSWPTCPQGVVSAVRKLINDERRLAEFKERLGDGWQRANCTLARSAASYA
jgi:hypothetical protein